MTFRPRRHRSVTSTATTMTRPTPHSLLLAKKFLRWYHDGDYPISAKFAPGDRVQIDVIYGDQHASAVGTVPQPVVGGSVKDVDVYSITEDEYYYLKVLNARGPDSYFDFEDDYSLTGDVKLPSNVTGGSGNIFLNARTSLSGYMHEDYVPEYVGESYPSDGWDDVPYEYGDEK